MASVRRRDGGGRAAGQGVSAVAPPAWSRDSVGALLTELLPRVRTRVRGLLRRDTEVDDVTQEALVAIYRGLPSYRGDGALVAWADQVVRRVSFAASRRARLERSRMDEEALAEVAAPSLDDAREDCLWRQRVDALLEQLPGEQRRVLVLHHVHGMSVPELAGVLCVPFETVRSRLRLGRAHLRELLAREGVPGGAHQLPGANARRRAGGDPNSRVPPSLRQGPWS
ncbi:sigma-70 family RNA polymerase sigma factor [Corallococcus sp. M34]|uniref:RNA polymerase sigma factor n=1 Tax=Citreicoccus inhibens TaxID=2849499 RepID=UPI001C23354E|nr:sigma-70 family RNA polymerase sigma factor [Citreicoccus inhibens]MBU8900309.1 sigma-70 family RNA polymerase sigma factor [Citreicoccus inhibens]